MRSDVHELGAEFTRREIAPHLQDWEDAGTIPRELHAAAAKQGVLGLGFPEEVGGSGGDVLDTLDLQEGMTSEGASSGLLAGLFTRLACLLGAGFLVTTYLLHPPFPWFPLPPGTEGNPVFVNKNVIEFLALMVLVCYPTGRWLGLDALISRVLFGPAPRPAEPA